MKTLWCLVLAGCTADEGPAPFAPEDVPTGIYSIDVSRVDDGCDPPRFVGDSKVPLTNTADGLQLFVVDDTSASRYTLPAAAGYTDRFPPVGIVAACADAAGVAFTFALASASANRVEVFEDEEWQAVRPCPEPGEVLSSVVSSTSCHASRVLRYDLVEACAPPCTIRSPVGLDTSTCSCP